MYDAEMTGLTLEIEGNNGKVVKTMPVDITFKYDPIVEKSINYIRCYLRAAGGSSFDEPYYYFTLMPYNDAKLLSVEDYTQNGISLVKIGKSRTTNYIDDEDLSKYNDIDNLNYSMTKDFSHYIVLEINYNKGELIANYYTVIVDMKLDNGETHRLIHSNVLTPYTYQQSVREYIDKNFS